MNNITVYGHAAKHVLDNIKENQYLFKCGDDDYVRIIAHENDETPDCWTRPYAIDPSGGPFMAEGSKLTKDLEITSIISCDEGYIINTKPI